MPEEINDAYVAPKVTTYGSVESITEGKDKVGDGEDEFSQGTPLTGSVF